LNLKGQYLQLPNHKIYYYTLGKGPKILFIHGHRSDALRFKGLFKSISEIAKVYAPDLPGCGKSPPYRTKWHSMRNYALTLQQFIEKLDLNKITLAGGSMGGMIALYLYPFLSSRINKLILLGTPASSSFFKAHYYKYRRMLKPGSLLLRTKLFPWVAQKIINSNLIMDYLMKRHFPPEATTKEIIEYEKKQWRTMRFSVWMQTMIDALNFHPSDKKLKINVPTLIVETKDNQYYDTQRNLALLTSIAPNHQIIFLPWETHVPKGDISADFLNEYRDKLVEFLRNT